MRKNILIIVVILISQIGFGQNINLLIEVNKKLITDEISNAFLDFENLDGTESKTLVKYFPGKLVLEPKDWEKINSKETKKIILNLAYNTYKKGELQTANFEIEMQKYHFEKLYLILNIYDFRDKKFKKMYECLTENNFMAELNFPQGGILIRCK